MDILTMYAQSQPDTAAVICDDQVITYAELEESANRLANALSDRGVEPSDKCTTVGYNSPEQFKIGSATRKILAVGVPMNYRLRPAEISYQLQNSESVVVFAGPEHVDDVESVRGECPTVRICVGFGRDDLPAGWKRFEDVVASGSPEPPQTEAGMTGPTMTYTAGTTGNPKGAYRAQGIDPAVLGTYVQLFQMRAGDVHLVAGPLYHSAPGAFAAFTSAMGGTNVLMRRFDPLKALQLIEKHRCRTTFMAPTLLRRIAELPEDQWRAIDLTSMEVVVVAAAPCPTELKRRIVEIFPDALYEFYGSSEAGINTIMTPAEQLKKPGSCGRVCDGVEIRILGDDGDELGAGEPGEVWIKGPSIITEYYRNPDATSESRRGEWFTVGDVGYFDEDGYLYISDRKRDMIISGGANIYCAEVENVIHSHPKVRDVAVFGVPSDEWGEAVHAVVQPKAGESLTAEEIQSWVGERLAGYKKPRSVEFRDDFPRDEAGKIRKRELREPYWSGRTTRV